MVSKFFYQVGYFPELYRDGSMCFSKLREDMLK